MNRAFLIILVPFILVTIFWLTLGWGWRVAMMGGCLEIAIAAAVAVFFSRRRAAANPGAGDSSASR
ncbi:MAG: hypothetical protein WA211_08255 [Candidatus Acidiferrales bacterium]